MANLFLLEPPLDVVGNESVAQRRISLLQELESILWSVITSGGRSEARLWLCITISRIRSIPRHDQSELFVDLLRSKPPKRHIASQLLQIIFEKHPQKVGCIIAKRSCMLENFFEGNPKRILQWFSNFAVVGESGHTKGARAISQFAFVNRDICWEELEWKGKHGQSPAMVATKPHYFLDLDVLRTVENFLENVPDFWSSDEFSESLKDGEILFIDKTFFVDRFVRMMYEENSEDVWALVNEFLMEEQFSLLCQHILILLDETELHVFLNSLRKILPTTLKWKDFYSQSYWLEILLSCNDSASTDELLLLAAVIDQGRQLLHLIHEDEHGEEKVKVEELLLNINKDSIDMDHWALMKKCLKMKKARAIKCLGLQSWALHYIMSRECKSHESCQSLFLRNGISFKKSNDYSLVPIDGNGFGLDDESSTRHERKKKVKPSKRRRKKYDRDDSSVDEQWAFEASNGWQDLKSGGGNWLLSTDGYSCSWNSADIPEHLARHCFSTWMEWVFCNWST